MDNDISTKVFDKYLIKVT